MILRIFSIILLFFFSNAVAQSSLEVQNSILKQYEKLIPKDSSFASWTMYEVYLNDDKVKDYVFSYILCKKNQRHIHSGSGVLMLETVGKNKFKIYGHIPASGKDIYTFTGYSGNTYFINEYSAASNYSKIKRQIKFEKRGEKLIAL